MSERRDWDFYAKLADQLAAQTFALAEEAEGLAYQARAVGMQMRAAEKFRRKRSWRRWLRKAVA